MLGPIGLLGTLVLIWAVAGSLVCSLCRAAADADRQADELLCRRVQRECVATDRRQPTRVELSTSRRYRGAHR